MTWVTSYIGLGSNLASPLQQLEHAIHRLNDLPDSTVTSVSRFYGNPALTAGQPDYVNAVAALRTRLSPHALLHHLQDIETAQGRVRAEPWAARTLDLDLLLYGDEIIATRTLTVPHPRMLERAFVLHPLAELAPALKLPDGTLLQWRVDCCPGHSLTPLSP